MAGLKVKLLKIATFSSLLGIPLATAISCVVDDFPPIPPEFVELRSLEVNANEDQQIREFVNANNIKDFFAFLAQKWNDQKYNIYDKYDFISPLKIEPGQEYINFTSTYDIWALIKGKDGTLFMSVPIPVIVI